MKKIVEFKSKNIEYEYIAIRDIHDNDIGKAAEIAGINTFKSLYEILKTTDFKTRERLILAVISEVCLFDDKKYSLKDLEYFHKRKPEKIVEIFKLIGVKIDKYGGY